MLCSSFGTAREFVTDDSSSLGSHHIEITVNWKCISVTEQCILGYVKEGYVQFPDSTLW